MDERIRLKKLLLQGEAEADKHGFFNCSQSETKADFMAKYLIENGVSVPSADVQAAKHGQWLKMDNGGACCSNCQNWYANANGRIDQTFRNKFRYCPYCGALMMEGKDSD